jgi:hypothetical protein
MFATFHFVQKKLDFQRKTRQNSRLDRIYQANSEEKGP